MEEVRGALDTPKRQAQMRSRGKTLGEILLRREKKNRKEKIPESRMEKKEGGVTSRAKCARRRLTLGNYPGRRDPLSGTSGWPWSMAGSLKDLNPICTERQSGGSQVPTVVESTLP